MRAIRFTKYFASLHKLREPMNEFHFIIQQIYDLTINKY